ncbi:MAG: hypothetical protein HZA15_14570 [Nitrospirae bacterium]|nr:hypothetical protein [Nitrospirota bacterium]
MINEDLIALPRRLEQDLSTQLAVKFSQTLEDALQVLDFSRKDASYKDSVQLLSSAAIFSQAKDSERTALALCHYAHVHGVNLINAGETPLGRGYVASSVQLFCQVVPFLTRHRDVSRLVEEIREIFGDYLKSLKQIPTAQHIALEAIYIIETIQCFLPYASPPLANCLREINVVLESLDRQPQTYLYAAKKLKQTRQRAETVMQRSSDRSHLLELVETWEQLLGEHPMDDMASIPTSASEIELEVRQSIKNLEQALRNLIEKKYKELFGASWVDHIRAKHPEMFKSWEIAQKKDRAAFQSYRDYEPAMLEYAYFKDLSDLINAQWQAFRTELDFREGKGNKGKFTEMMEAIARVRNPIAHHRAIPPTELYRAKVYCDDILNALHKTAL